jgi:hypothetical protein
MLVADSDLTVAALLTVYRYFAASTYSYTNTLLPFYSATIIKKELLALEHIDKVMWLRAP